MDSVKSNQIKLLSLCISTAQLQLVGEALPMFSCLLINKMQTLPTEMKISSTLL